jgi:uncharacterized membrane protein
MRDMGGHDLAEVVGVACAVLGLSTIVSILIWQWSKTRRARLLAAREQDYAVLAERSSAAIEANESRLAGLTSRLAKMQSQVDALEKLLKDIE